ncbi:flippase-like domain-containing protein [Alkalicella caledoniensis]|uniref:Phosphatidylglycerol lysyltransferase n=1 Tax=Alkalicella caledoniensis TaxID=2731377 RepID=A0A7G9W901_ALKCA|nr:lysylphosphatidylglycerol synthase transmembrane domain-containing protein [Alkalicella caledoniensis]QNO15163.1 flippase-like domain-containing protein [Alkalicella caledoniensis]
MKKRFAKGLLVLAIAIGVLINIALLIRDFHPTTVESLKAIDKNLIITLLFLLILSWLIEGLRLKWLSNKLKINLNLKDAIKLHLVTMFGAFSTPLGSGEIPMFMYWGLKKGEDLESFSALAILRLLFTKMIFLSFIVANYIIYRGNRGWGAVGEGAFYAVTVMVLGTFLFYTALVFKLNSLKKLTKFIKFLPNKFKDKEVVVTPQVKEILLHKPFIPFLLTLCYWIVFFSPAIILAQRLNLPLNPIGLLFQQATVYMTIPLSPVPGGAGVVELLYYGIFSNLLSGGQLAVFILIIRFINFYIPLMVGAFIAIRETKLF